MLTLVRATISEFRRSGLRFSTHGAEPVVPDFSAKFANYPEFVNERVLEYKKDSVERKHLNEAVTAAKNQLAEIPIVIGDHEYHSSDKKFQVMPHNHSHQLAKYSYASEDLIQKAIKVAVDAQPEWENYPAREKANIFNRAADLIAQKYRFQINAATMLGQSKTALQAEIDAAAELIDFFRYNAYQLKELYKYKPISPAPNVEINSMRYRALEGFVASISPFNFTAIGGNLAFTPALMGNCVVWKPSDSAMLSNFKIFQIMREAGLPPGVVNFVPADGPVFGQQIAQSPHLAAVNFTGSVGTFNTIWKTVANNIDRYKTYPRLIGECGGKNYHFIHPSGDLSHAANCTIRSAFEYSGQKCSACSRLYVPQSFWAKVKDLLTEAVTNIKVGDPSNYDNFMGAVIDDKSFNRLKDVIETVRKSDLHEVIGGKIDGSSGYFIQPTVINCLNPMDWTMQKEFFGPIVSVYVYKDQDATKMLKLVAQTSPYALTGAVFANDKDFILRALRELEGTAGNFYINDKSTGSVVGQQPFGGARLSGTNDKAGGPHYLLRFASPQSIKESFARLDTWNYPYMKK